MKIALIGASGFVGSAILNEALNREHKVTAIVRNPLNIKIENSNLTIIKADVFKDDEVVKAVKGNDVVISAYNSGWSNPDIYKEFIKGSQSIEAGVKKSGIKRLIVVGGAGSLYLPDGTQIVDSAQFPAEWKEGAKASRDYLNILKKEKDIEWTFLSPALEMHHGTSGVRRVYYKTGLENPVFDENGRSVISVEDIAVAIIDEVENPKHIRKRFTVAY
ncbi:MAG: NAD(P)-dependent oxidoreductase [Ginsengibacter sp.]